MTDGDADGGERPDERRPDHLADLPDGCGCAEVWDHLSERRGADAEAGE
jgi:hypothetical protein